LKPFPIPVVRAENKIPHGEYCYTSLGEVSPQGGLRIKPCPYWKLLPDLPAQENGWCDYLKAGDQCMPGASLLWDGVKECGIKTEESVLV
jgi:hypothetical protein